MTTRKRSVLIIDDDPDHRDLLGEVLQAEGYSVRATGDGAEALDWLDTTRPDVIMLDMVMPRAAVDGFAFITRLGSYRAEVRAIPLVLVSGLGESLRDAIDANAVETLHIAGVVAKPIHIEQLLRVVRSAATKPPSSGPGR
jgi:two-component system, NtrC family, nitrogen regulation response regulator NtrX